MTIETKMDPLAASFAAMEEAPHEEAVAEEEVATEPEQSPAEKVAEHIAAVRRWMDAHTVAAARPALDLATWTSGGWRFLAPVDGMRIWRRDTGVFTFWTGSAWRDGELTGNAVVIEGKTVVGLQQLAISDITGGAVVDGEARAAIAAILAALRAHGLIAT